MSKSSWLLLHGAGGGAWEWVIWQRVLEARGRLVSVPEYAPISAGIAATTFTDYHRQALAAVDKVSGPMVLVGASLGGLLALMVAQSACPRALVLINPMPPAPWHHLLSVKTLRPAVIPWRRGASLQSTRRALPDAADATCDWAWRRWRDESAAVLDAASSGVQVPRPSCPTLVLASVNDAEVPAEASQQLAYAWAADLWRLPDASHVGPLLGVAAAGLAERVLAWADAH